MSVVRSVAKDSFDNAAVSNPASAPPQRGAQRENVPIALPSTAAPSPSSRPVSRSTIPNRAFFPLRAVVLLCAGEISSSSPEGGVRLLRLLLDNSVVVVGVVIPFPTIPIPLPLATPPQLKPPLHPPTPLDGDRGSAAAAEGDPNREAALIPNPYPKLPGAALFD